MFCRFCGKPIKDKAVVCAGCGRPVEGPGSSSDPSQRWSFATLAILMAVTVFLPPIGLVFGFLGLRNPHRKTQAAVLLTVSVFMTLLMAAIILGL
ncbi:MAG: zinc ribbon domain-containing protein [Methylococcaceae bacterium]|nr:zinc ribbon domain-containing protein [Methylococcaceae bacterium]